MGFPLVVMPDAEQSVLAHLRTVAVGRQESYMTGVTFGTRIDPGITPTKYVRIRRTGGITISPVAESPVIDVQVWHDDDKSRMLLAQLIRSLLYAARGSVAGGVTWYRVQDVLGPAQIPDPSDATKTIVMFTLEIGMRGAQTV